jgi:alkanesulfonate monooxygenase SsuD/methylene tetrahydromethanopterin reductase-like flavin-dependent oxidoreductase (luciferase family)
MCSYFIHFADTKGEEEAARARQIRYYKECVIAAFPGDPRTAPPSYRYFIEMVERLRNVGPADLNENSVLLGTPAQITETLQKVEAAGFDEVILYFNVGLKSHAQVKEEMARFMAEVAPAFTRRPSTAAAPRSPMVAARP